MNPLKVWNRFWFAPISARPLGVYRIVFGCFVLIHLGLLSVDFDYWMTDAGLFRGEDAVKAAGMMRYSLFQWIQDPFSVRLITAGIACVTVGFTLGWQTKIMSVLMYFGLLSIHHRNLATSCGPDTLMMITSFYLMLSPCGAAYSLDARRRALKRGTAAEPLIYPWAQRLIQIQVALIYFATAAFKCHGSSWLGGTAIHYVLFNHEVGQFNLEWLARYPVVINLMTYSALIVEFSLAFLLWFRPSRKWIALVGLGLHAGIVPLVNVPLFGEQMTAMYLLFLGPEELTRFLAFLNPARWLGRRASWASLSSAVETAPAMPGWKQLELSFPTPDVSK